MSDSRVTSRYIGIGVTILCVAVASRDAGAAQDRSGTTSSGSGVAGVVKDTTGALLPGVTVEAASPALVNQIRSAVTDDEGKYRIADLPPGVYTVSFSLANFKPFKRDGVVLSSAFTVTVNAELSVVALQETVIVTARKLVEDLQRVPQSIAADTAADLEAKSVQRLSDLGQVTPNLLYGQKVQSGSSAGQVYIRGIGQQDTKALFNPGVGISVDGVYLGRAQANDLDMADVKQVEVLYGPQGTLFGKNSNGGAINIVTTKPDLTAPKPAGSIELQTGNFGRLDALGVLNVPLVANKAALQVSVTRRGQDGYSKRIDGQDQANQNRTSGRAQLLLKPTDTFEAIFRVDGTTFDERSGAYRLVEVRETNRIPLLYAALTPYRYDNRWVTKSDFEVNGTGPNKDAGHVWGTSLTLAWDRSWGTLKSITAYRNLYADSEFDPDGSPLTVLDILNPIHQHQFSQELQATGTSFNGRLRWVTGVYYFREHAQDFEPSIVAFEIFQGDANLSYNNWVVNENPAAFGQATFDLTNRLKLTAGGRLGEDKVDAQRIQVGYPVPVVQQPLVSRSASWTSFLPRVGLDYQWTPDVMIYVSAAEGSKSGGFNGRAASIEEFTRYEPEKVWAYEAGLRSEWFDKHVRFNATGFYSNYKDFQIQLNRSTIDPETGLPHAFSFVGNMPKATIKGGEFTLAAVPRAGLRVLAGLGITDGKYVTLSPGAPVTPDSEFVNAPKFTVTAGAEYVMAIGKLGQLVGRGDYIHKSTIQYDYSNSPLVAQRPFSLLNARLTWQTPNPRVSLDLFGTNLTDTHYALGGLDDGPTGGFGEVIKLMGPPREWGVGVHYRF
jgi:iron complex outermembrane receptor protein